jgi:hypothetical protein
MKYIYLLLLLFVSSIGFSQTNGISYQALILDPTNTELPGVDHANAPLVNTDVCLKFEIVDQNSTLEYAETIQTTTDEFGMVNLVIGTGIKIDGYANTFSDIEWNLDSKSLEVNLSTSGACSSYTEISNQPLTSVPFALNASTALDQLDTLSLRVSDNLSNTNAAITVVQADVDANEAAANTAIEAVKSDVDANEAAANTAIEAVQADVDANEAAANIAIAAVQADVDANEAAANKAISAVQTDVDANEAAANTAIAVVQADVDANEAAANTAIALVQADVDANEATANTAIAAVQTDVDVNEAAANTAISAVQADVDANEAAANKAIAIVQTDVDANTNEISTLKSSVSSQNSRIASMDGKISTNTNDINTLENLADGKIYLGNSSNVAIEVDVTGDVTIDNTGATTIGTTNRSNRNKGDILYWTGSDWTTIPAGNDGAVLQLVSGIPTWVSGPDIILPSITLKGDSIINMKLNGTFTDPGATTDEGTLSTSGTVNVNTPGTYTLTYTATDAAGNTASASRKVNVYKSQFSYTGSAQTFTVPAGVTSISVNAYGGSGYYGTTGGHRKQTIRGGKRGRVEADLIVTPGDVLYIYVGGEGSGGGAYNGGGRAMGGYGGGGATHIATVTGLLSNLKDSAVEDIDGDGNYTEKSGNPVLIVAGAGGAGHHRLTTVGGAGGGKTGANGGRGTSSGKTIQLTGGTQVKGGYGHSATRNGKFGKGGDAYSSGGSSYGANGGGAGWFGGGGGWYETMAGAGGSSYTHPVLCSKVIHTQGDGYNNGQLIITIP